MSWIFTEMCRKLLKWNVGSLRGFHIPRALQTYLIRASRRSVSRLARSWIDQWIDKKVIKTRVRKKVHARCGPHGRICPKYLSLYKQSHNACTINQPKWVIENRLKCLPTISSRLTAMSQEPTGDKPQADLLRATIRIKILSTKVSNQCWFGLNSFSHYRLWHAQNEIGWPLAPLEQILLEPSSVWVAAGKDQCTKEAWNAPQQRNQDQESSQHARKRAKAHPEESGRNSCASCQDENNQGRERAELSREDQSQGWKRSCSTPKVGWKC